MKELHTSFASEMDICFFQAVPCMSWHSVWVQLGLLCLRLVSKSQTLLMWSVPCASWLGWVQRLWKFWETMALWSVYTQLVCLNLNHHPSSSGLVIQIEPLSLTFLMIVKSNHLEAVMEEILCWERNALLYGLPAQLVVTKDGWQNTCWYDV